MRSVCICDGRGEDSFGEAKKGLFAFSWLQMRRDEDFDDEWWDELELVICENNIQFETMALN